MSAESTGTFPVKRGLAEMMKGGVIMDVVNAEQARIAEDAGAVAVMALERVPADIRVDGGVARMSDPEMIDGIQAVCSIPVMAKVRIGHFVEAQIIQSLGVDFIDESEVLTPADEAYHIDKMAFDVPFVCGATNLGEALRRISEGAAMIRSKGEAGTGNVVEAVRHLRSILGDIKRIATKNGHRHDAAALAIETVRVAAEFDVDRCVNRKWRNLTKEGQTIDGLGDATNWLNSNSNLVSKQVKRSDPTTCRTQPENLLNRIPGQCSI